MLSSAPPTPAPRTHGIGRKIVVGLLIALAVLALPSLLLVRIFVAQPYNLPSGSMEPTLLIGDFIFVSKFAYGYSRYSLPLSPPLFSGRIFGAEPQRGDVVVFRFPRDDSVDYIKRIVGLPGDRVQMVGGVLHLNGTPVKHERVDDLCRRELVRQRDLPRQALEGDAAQRRELRDARLPGQRLSRQHGSPDRAGGSLFRARRQSRQLDRQPPGEPVRLRAVRPPRRPRHDGVLLVRRHERAARTHGNEGALRPD
jgi:signal peptidase I